jgi:hypothetical protein
VVEVVARGFGEGVEEFHEAVAAEGAGESGVDFGRHKQKTIPRMTRIVRIFTDPVSM